MTTETVVVPVEPTSEMLRAGRGAMKRYYNHLRVYGKKLPKRIPDDGFAQKAGKRGDFLCRW